MFIDSKYGRSRLKELLSINRESDILSALNTTESRLLRTLSTQKTADKEKCWAIKPVIMRRAKSSTQTANYLTSWQFVESSKREPRKILTYHK